MTANARVMRGQAASAGRLPRPNESRTNAYVHAVSRARARLRHAQRRVSKLEREQRAYPGSPILTRELKAAARPLLPSELRRALLWLPAPQAALLRTARETRHIALGAERADATHKTP